jgi:hypothetical protein
LQLIGRYIVTGMAEHFSEQGLASHANFYRPHRGRRREPKQRGLHGLELRDSGGPSQGHRWPPPAPVP